MPLVAYNHQIALDIDVGHTPNPRHNVYPIPIRNVKELKGGSRRPARDRTPYGRSVSENQVEDFADVVDYYLDVRHPKRPEGRSSELTPGRSLTFGLLKEVIQPQVPLRLPCYDFTLIADLAVGAPLLAVGVTTSGATNSGGVTGGVYKARERIHRGMLIRDY